MKTIAELEMENPDGFRNPVRTPEQEARNEAIRIARREHEAIHTPIDNGSDDEEEDDD